MADESIMQRVDHASISVYRPKRDALSLLPLTSPKLRRYSWTQVEIGVLFMRPCECTRRHPRFQRNSRNPTVSTDEISGIATEVTQHVLATHDAQRKKEMTNLKSDFKHLQASCSSYAGSVASKEDLEQLNVTVDQRFAALDKKYERWCEGTRKIVADTNTKVDNLEDEHSETRRAQHELKNGLVTVQRDHAKAIVTQRVIQEDNHRMHAETIVYVDGRIEEVSEDSRRMHAEATVYVDGRVGEVSEDVNRILQNGYASSSSNGQHERMYGFDHGPATDTAVNNTFASELGNWTTLPNDSRDAGHKVNGKSISQLCTELLVDVEDQLEPQNHIRPVDYSKQDVQSPMLSADETAASVTESLQAAPIDKADYPSPDEGEEDGLDALSDIETRSTMAAVVSTGWDEDEIGLESCRGSTPSLSMAEEDLSLSPLDEGLSAPVNEQAQPSADLPMVLQCLESGHTGGIDTEAVPIDNADYPSPDEGEEDGLDALSDGETRSTTAAVVSTGRDEDEIGLESCRGSTPSLSMAEEDLGLSPLDEGLSAPVNEQAQPSADLPMVLQCLESGHTGGIDTEAVPIDNADYPSPDEGEEDGLDALSDGETRSTTAAVVSTGRDEDEIGLESCRGSTPSLSMAEEDLGLSPLDEGLSAPVNEQAQPSADLPMVLQCLESGHTGGIDTEGTSIGIVEISDDCTSAVDQDSFAAWLNRIYPSSMMAPRRAGPATLQGRVAKWLEYLHAHIHIGLLRVRVPYPRSAPDISWISSQCSGYPHGYLALVLDIRAVLWISHRYPRVVRHVSWSLQDLSRHPSNAPDIHMDIPALVWDIRAVLSISHGYPRVVQHVSWSLQNLSRYLGSAPDISWISSQCSGYPHGYLALVLDIRAVLWISHRYPRVVRHVSWSLQDLSRHPSNAPDIHMDIPALVLDIRAVLWISHGYPQVVRHVSWSLQDLSRHPSNAPDIHMDIPALVLDIRAVLWISHGYLVMSTSVGCLRVLVGAPALSTRVPSVYLTRVGCHRGCPPECGCQSLGHEYPPADTRNKEKQRARGFLAIRQIGPRAERLHSGARLWVGVCTLGERLYVVSMETDLQQGRRPQDDGMGLCPAVAQAYRAAEAGLRARGASADDAARTDSDKIRRSRIGVRERRDKSSTRRPLPPAPPTPTSPHHHYHTIPTTSLMKS
ncbi:hypothetical protein BDZ89DRAFT_1034237 [Hymenopellis radicata]|nr:hypothetical protein BDZ89DRAFT_1034237 [Hymenopellis radicata]